MIIAPWKTKGPACLLNVLFPGPHHISSVSLSRADHLSDCSGQITHGAAIMDVLAEEKTNLEQKVSARPHPLTISIGFHN